MESLQGKVNLELGLDRLVQVCQMEKRREFWVKTTECPSLQDRTLRSKETILPILNATGQKGSMNCPLQNHGLIQLLLFQRENQILKLGRLPASKEKGLNFLSNEVTWF